MQKRLFKGISLLLAGTLSVLLIAPVSQAAAKKPALSKTNINLKEGKSKKLSVKNRKGYKISWKSSRKSVASVSKVGKIKAKKEGKARITATVQAPKKGRVYRLVCNVSVDRMFQDGEGSNETMTPGASPVPAYTEKPVTQPSTGPMVQTEGGRVLFSKKIIGFNRDLFGDQLITSYEQFQNLMQTAEEEAKQRPEWCCSLQWMIGQLKGIDSDYFISNVLCVNTVYLTTGYSFELASASQVDGEQGTKVLKVCLDKNWDVPPGYAVTCDMAYYNCFTQIPRDVAQGCSHVVCEVTERGYDKEHGVMYPTEAPPSPAAPTGVLDETDIRPATSQAVILETELPDEDAVPGQAYVYQHCCPKFKNQVVADYETLLGVVGQLKNELEAPFNKEIISELECYGEDFFEQNSLVLGCYDKTNGYDSHVQSLTVKTDEAGNRILNCNMEFLWIIPEDCCVTCDMVFHNFLIEVPAGLVRPGDKVTVTPTVVKPE